MITQQNNTIAELEERFRGVISVKDQEIRELRGQLHEVESRSATMTNNQSN